MKGKKSVPASKSAKSTQAKTKSRGLSIFGKVIFTLFSVGVLTTCIVGACLSVFILRYVDVNANIDLTQLPLSYTTILYANDKETGEPYELAQLSSSQNRTWVDFEDIPKDMINATIAAEDKRFMEHNGVDWLRTIGAFINEVIPIYPNRQGASTLTQQLIRQVTGEDEIRVERKVKEIFMALNLEKEYSKDQIITAYLNVVYMGNNCYGIQAASQYYFGKDVKDLTAKECATLIATVNAPSVMNPFADLERNQDRVMNFILPEMYDLGMFESEEAYQEALNQEIVLNETHSSSGSSTVQTYAVDHVIEEVIDDLMESEGLSYEEAQYKLYNGGLRIYTTIDEDMQTMVEDMFADDSTFAYLTSSFQPQAAMAIIDNNGQIKALVGGRGEKTINRGINRADGTGGGYRSPGSAIKPLTAYLQAFESDMITWSTLLEDEPLETDSNGNPYPQNTTPYEGWVTVDKAIQISKNTTALRLVREVTPQRCYDFLVEKFSFEKLDPADAAVGGAPMAMGSLTYGVTPLELAGAFQIYANGGTYTEPYSYTKVTDSEGFTILQKDTSANRVISKDTYQVMNKLLQRVVNGPYISNMVRVANLGSMPVAAKTGTTSDGADHWFVGMTPYYTAAIWVGYDTPTPTDHPNNIPPMVYHNVMTKVHEGLPVIDFPEVGNLVSKTYCLDTGDLATANCPNTATGWYKESNIPGTCTQHVFGGSESTESESSSEESSEPAA